MLLVQVKEPFSGHTHDWVREHQARLDTALHLGEKQTESPGSHKARCGQGVVCKFTYVTRVSGSCSNMLDIWFSVVDKIIKAPLRTCCPGECQGNSETRSLEDLRASPIVTVQCSDEPQNSRAGPDEVNWDDEPCLRLTEEGRPSDQAVSSPNNHTTAVLGRHPKPFELPQTLGNQVGRAANSLTPVSNLFIRPWGEYSWSQNY